MLDMTPHYFRIKSGEDTTVTVTNTRSTVPAVFSGEHYAYIVGRTPTEVAPLDNITRAEIATVFYRMLNDQARADHYVAQSMFPDVDRNAWYGTAVTTLAHMGIVQGDQNGSFNPDAFITRAEFAAIAARFDENGNATGVTFADIYGHWAQREIAIVARNGWVLGYEDGTFRPDQLVTRAEAMAMVNRVLQRIPQSGADLLPGMKIWSDNQDPNAWYYLTIQEATNSHGHDRRTSGYEYWTELREAPDWSWLERQWVPDRKDEGDRDVPPEGDRDMPEALPEEIPAQ